MKEWNGDVRVGTLGTVRLYGREHLWEIDATPDGSRPVYRLREFEIRPGGAVVLGRTIEGQTPKEAVDAARPEDADAATRYAAPAVFGLADVRAQLAELRDPCLAALPRRVRGGANASCGKCEQPLVDGSVAQSLFHACRVCVRCADSEPSAARESPTTSALASAATSLATAYSRAPVTPSTTRHAASAPVSASATESVASACRAPASAPAALRQAAVHTSAVSGRFAAALFTSGTTLTQFATCMAILDTPLPMSKTVYYSKEQPSLIEKLRAARDELLDRRIAELAARPHGPGVRVVIELDGSYSHRRNANECDALSAKGPKKARLTKEIDAVIPFG